MTLSYNWLCEYLPRDEFISNDLIPSNLGAILTSVGLEVESLEIFEEFKGNLAGLVVAEVLRVEQHPGADRLKITEVATGNGELLQIVCGANNVTVGQKVVVAPVGETIYPRNDDPVTIKRVKIRGVESEGMICAGDEIGVNDDHSGIMVLPAASETGTALSSLLQPYTDHVYEIGLTPNRMDAMSHLGVAKDVVAWLNHHRGPVSLRPPPYENPNIKKGDYAKPLEIFINEPGLCKRYSGVVVSGITVTESPKWLRDKLKAIAVNPINNIVDITNFILHETGQPLHAFDLDAIRGEKIIVKNASAGYAFQTLDGIIREMDSADLMICNEFEPMCIAGVYGGAHSGVTAGTHSIFLESAFFSGAGIRRTALRHGLRTDAATRFEKGTDISRTLDVLKRAAALVCEISGGSVAGEFIDQYPDETAKTQVKFGYNFLTRLSGKKYREEEVRKILMSLGFEIHEISEEEILVTVPYNKPDISTPADLVEEVMRIDGLDNIEIPATIKIAPSVEKNRVKFTQRERAANYLTGSGFHEIFNNSITNSALYTAEVLETAVNMINSLSSELNMLRPDMLKGGLDSIAYNVNRKNTDLLFFEFGKIYSANSRREYVEQNRLALFLTGKRSPQHWREVAGKTDVFFLKGIISQLFSALGFHELRFVAHDDGRFVSSLSLIVDGRAVGFLGQVSADAVKGIKQAVFYADIDWDALSSRSEADLTYTEIQKFPTVSRDLALVVDKNVSYSGIEAIALAAKITDLRSVRLFDIFHNDKLGNNKKSMALSFVFSNEQKTLTDIEVDGYMQKLMSSYKSDIGAEIRM